MRLRFLTTSLTFLGVSLLPIASSVAFDMKDLFDSYSSGAPGRYQTSDGKYFYGGNFTTRAKLVEHDFANFTPPSVKAGCSGIDFFAGSFSVISGDEIVQMARGIAQGASGYFFNMAISSICATCADTMREFAGRLEELNKFSQNSCERFWDYATDKDNPKDKVEGEAKSKALLLDSSVGATLSWADSGLANGMKHFGLDAGAPGALTVETANKTFAGNLIFRKIDDSFVTLRFSMPGFTTKLSRIELMMSLFGTVIISSAGEVTPKPPIPELMLNMLKGAPRLELYKCADLDESTCLDMRKQTHSNYVGLHKHHYDMISGPDGIITRISQKRDLSPAQLEYRNQNTFNFTAVARKFKPEQIDTLSNYLSLMIASQQITDMFTQFINALYELKAAPPKGDRINADKEIKNAIDRAMVDKAAVDKYVLDKQAEQQAVLNVLMAMNALMDGV